jgi:DNA-binding Lrp family transcriptional regulator
MDAVNRRITEHLLRDGRATYQQIGDAVGLSAPAVKRRVDLMVSRGEIAGFTALIDPQALGWDLEAYVEVIYSGNVVTSRLTRELEDLPEVVGLWTVSGEADALVHVMAADMAAIERTVTAIRKVPNVTRTRTLFVMSRVFERPRTEV